LPVEVFCFFGVFDDIVEFGPSSPDVFESAGDNAEEGVGVVSCGGEAFAVEVPVFWEGWVLAEILGEVFSVNEGRVLYAEEAVERGCDVNEPDEVFNFFRLVIAGQFYNERYLYGGLINEESVVVFAVFGEHFAVVSG
jgi:hypothetical protein